MSISRKFNLGTKSGSEVCKNLNIEVFFWECIALRPEYVKIMQSKWMENDISTITNAHPDHEDIQGPAGIDIAHSITSFISRNNCCQFLKKKRN